MADNKELAKQAEQLADRLDTAAAGRLVVNPHHYNHLVKTDEIGLLLRQCARALAQGEPGELPPFYISGPYPADGAYSVCDVYTSRILIKFDASGKALYPTASAPAAVEPDELSMSMFASVADFEAAKRQAAVEPDERAKRDKQHRDLFFAAYHLLDGVCEDHPALADVLNVDAHGALCHALAQLDVFYGINGPEDIAPPIKAEPGSRLEYELHVLNSKASASKGTPT